MGLICFDLDGTLVDPLEAVTLCVGGVFRERGLPEPSTRELAPFMGPGAATYIAEHPAMSDGEDRREVLQRFWERFEREGIVRHRVYDGVMLMLARLKRQGHGLYAITSKPTRLARRVLHQFDLLLTFQDVFGSTWEDPWKGKVEILELMRMKGILEPGGYLVGDRGEDMAAAGSHGLVPLGVTYGFGSAQELREGGARELFDSVPALDAWFSSVFPEPERFDPFTRSE
jgi:phosphoglycolate phosphatase